jgi:hypothetical protein
VIGATISSVSVKTTQNLNAIQLILPVDTETSGTEDLHLKHIYKESERETVRLSLSLSLAHKECLQRYAHRMK